MILEENQNREKDKIYDKSINPSASLLSSQDSFRQIKKRKIIIIGAPGVGKSAIIMRFKDDIFLDYYEPTIQNLYKKSFYFNFQPTELEIVDIDGQTEYTIFSFSKLTFGIHGYIFCYSIENRQSFELLKILHAKLINLVGRDIPKILCANKSDLGSRREISVEEGKSFAKIMGCPFIECSAKSNYNISKSFHVILTEIDRYENSGDFKKIGCKKLLGFFARKESLMTIIFYLVTFLNFISGTLFLVFGFYLGITSFVNNSLYFGLLLLIGLWKNIFNFIGVYGVKKRKKHFLDYHTIGSLITVILSISAIIFSALMEDMNSYEDSNVWIIKNKFFLFFIPVSIVLDTILLIFSMLFKRIYQYDLISFYADC